MASKNSVMRLFLSINNSGTQRKDVLVGFSWETWHCWQWPNYCPPFDRWIRTWSFFSLFFIRKSTLPDNLPAIVLLGPSSMVLFFIEINNALFFFAPHLWLGPSMVLFLMECHQLIIERGKRPCTGPAVKWWATIWSLSITSRKTGEEVFHLCFSVLDKKKRPWPNICPRYDRWIPTWSFFSIYDDTSSWITPWTDPAIKWRSKNRAWLIFSI